VRGRGRGANQAVARPSAHRIAADGLRSDHPVPRVPPSKAPVSWHPDPMRRHHYGGRRGYENAWAAGAPMSGDPCPAKREMPGNPNRGASRCRGRQHGAKPEDKGQRSAKKPCRRHALSPISRADAKPTQYVWGMTTAVALMLVKLHRVVLRRVRRGLPDIPAICSSGRVPSAN
jgi:hypothetical protein